MGWNWGDESLWLPSYDEPPDRPGDWSAFDVLLIGLAFVILTVIGIVSAGGPS